MKGIATAYFNLFGSEAASLLHELREPCEKEPRTEGVEEVHAADDPELAVGSDVAPRDVLALLLYDFLCLFSLSRTDMHLLVRLMQTLTDGAVGMSLVTVGVDPHQRPYRSDASEQIE